MSKGKRQQTRTPPHVNKYRKGPTLVDQMATRPGIVDELVIRAQEARARLRPELIGQAVPITPARGSIPTDLNAGYKDCSLEPKRERYSSSWGW